MEDKKIIELFFERSEDAIRETERKYGAYCHRIAFNILSDELDAQECVNDTYLRAWNAIPPHRPERLSSFLGKITRNVALNRYAHNKALKRSAGIEAVYEELSELIPDRGNEADEEGIAKAINAFLATLPRRTRIIFVQRYWYLCPIKEIAQKSGMTESHVKVTLMRARKKLREFLKKEGITV